MTLGRAMTLAQEAARTSGVEDAERQSKGFRRVRDAHVTELAEDYVELIADLIEQTGEARVVDLAGRLGVANATVSVAIRRLQRDGLVTSKPYRSIFLTPKGQAVAAAARARHSLVRDFLIALGVDAETAAADAEGIEHHVSEATLNALRRYLGKRRRLAGR
jgi:DtxR family manganese transport transcriptional regulator